MKTLTWNERIETVNNNLLNAAFELEQLAADASCKTDHDELQEIANTLLNDITLRVTECKF